MNFEPPQNTAAEWSVINHMLAMPKTIPEIVGTQIEPDDFFSRDCRLIYERATEDFYSDLPVDPVSVGESLKFALAQLWSVPEGQVSQKLATRVQGHRFSQQASDHARVVKSVGDKRRLQVLALSAVHAIKQGDMSSEEIGDMMATEAAKVTTGSLKRGEVMQWLQVGSAYAKHVQRVKAARERGVEMGAYFGMPFFDHFTKGLGPTELMMVAGDPGAGKSMVSWRAAEGFARRQMQHDPDKRIGTLILSMEMGIVPSSQRIATGLTGIDGAKFREGKIDDEDLRTLVREWKRQSELPLYFNFASNFKQTQMRALIVEAIRKHNVGLIVIDHFRTFDPDRRINNANQEDEAKARFLKEDIAKDLNVAVVCLAHTVKMSRDASSDGRPRLSDLRGSGQVAAYCDIVTMIYRPIMYASEDDVFDGTVKPTDAEAIFVKNRNGELGTADFFMDPAKNVVREK